MVELEEFLGPRHFCFHPSLDILYFSNEQGCSVSGYRLDTGAGTLSIFQTITTLPPEGFCREEHLLPDSDHRGGQVSLCAQPGP